MSLIVILVGLVSYLQLTVREYPNIDEPIVSVRTDYPGASAEIIETQVTQVLEGSIAGIEGIETMTSSSEPEESRITVRFRLSRSEEHTSELQSLMRISYAVFCLKKKTKQKCNRSKKDINNKEKKERHTIAYINK